MTITLVHSGMWWVVSLRLKMIQNYLKIKVTLFNKNVLKLAFLWSMLLFQVYRECHTQICMCMGSWMNSMWWICTSKDCVIDCEVRQKIQWRHLERCVFLNPEQRHYFQRHHGRVERALGLSQKWWCPDCHELTVQLLQLTWNQPKLE